VPVVFLIAIVAVLVGIFFAATGRGGELSYEHADHAPLDLGPVSAADIALLRPPTALWGYSMQVTDEALDSIARAMRQRDVTIAFLQEQLAAMARNGAYVEPRGAHAREDLAPGIPSWSEASEISEAADTLEAPEILESPQGRWDADIAEAPEILDSPQGRWDADIAEAPEVLESPQGRWDADIAEAPEVLDSPQGRWDADIAEAPEILDSPQGRWDADIAEAPEAAVTPEPAQAAEASETLPPPEAAETVVTPEPPQTPSLPQTPLVLKASPAKTPPAPGPDDPTHPTEALQDPEAHDVTQPTEALQDPEAHDVTQPTETLAPHEPHGPQGSFNTHDWWAEQEKAARAEPAHRAAGPSGVAGDDSPAAAEEQGW
jgi:hypothetical protein